MKYVAELARDQLPETYDSLAQIRYLDIGAVGRGYLTAEPEILTFIDAPSRARQVVRPGDILVSTVRPYLRAIIQIEEAGSDLIASTGFAILRCLPGFESRYLYYWCLSDPFIETVVSKSKGVSYPAIGASELLELPVALPPRETQRRITDMLDLETTRIDALIAKNGEVLRLFAERVRRRRHRLVWPDELAALGKSPLACHGADSAEMTRLQYVAPYRIAGGTPRTHDTAMWTDVEDEGGTAWFGVGDVVEGRPTKPPTRRVSPRGLAATGLRALSAGTVVMAMYAVPGRAGILSERGVTNQAILSFIPDRRRLLDGYLLQWLVFIEPLLSARSRSNTQDNLNARQVSELAIRVPSLDEQYDIIKHMDEIAGEGLPLNALIGHQNDLLRTRRQALITAAVTGQIEV